MSQYIANLNTIPSATDMSTQQDFGNFDDDLNLFTNTQFFDFDMNETVPNVPGDIAFSATNNPKPQESPEGINFVERECRHLSSHSTQYPSTNLALAAPTFHMPDFSSYAQHHRMSSQGLPPSPPNGLASYPLAPQQPAFSHTPVAGEKRKATLASIASPADFEDGSRGAAEEDKRRRNTAASARFRVKKKQREQALEKTAKEMTDRVQVLEARVGQLEMENKWLKGLITEKNLKRPETPADPAAPDTSESVSNTKDQRSTEERKDGVGTADKADKGVTA